MSNTNKYQITCEIDKVIENHTTYSLTITEKVPENKVHKIKVRYSTMYLFSEIIAEQISYSHIDFNLNIPEFPSKSFLVTIFKNET